MGFSKSHDVNKMMTNIAKIIMSFSFFNFFLL
ncbi:hypothetical protein SPIROBIBN47_330004 [uncultured spirochete]|uniref:Uncharacterized protein n=1 Tax=uncultured spirochete TaxID=156406 RepID=A0A3P3XK20_9SPIR|nr:hypothetical protein SPIROBIBN47_330004 [uncultured spirochete]